MKPSDNATRDRLEAWVPEARIALSALRAGSVEAALDLSRGISTDTPEGEAWRRFVQGELAAKVNRVDAAEGPFLRAAAVAESEGEAMLRTDPEAARRFFRLAALAYHRLGELNAIEERRRHKTRLERVGVAYWIKQNFQRILESFEAAHSIRERFGTPRERWETAVSLAVLLKRRERRSDALTWILRALEAAEDVEEGGEAILARSWNLLADVLTKLGRTREAEAAARNACTFSTTSGADAEAARACELLADTSTAVALELMVTDRGAGRTKAREAETHLRRAIEVYDRLGAEAAAAGCRERLLRLTSTIDDGGDAPSYTRCA